jgi:glycosyltransferase involved in cell wall biosynthesis
MNSSKQVYLHVWNGNHDEARRTVCRQYPDFPIVEVSHEELRSRGWRGQIRALRSLKGKALAVFFESLEDTPQLQLVIWTALIHRCGETMIADGRGNVQVYKRHDLFRIMPRTVLSVFCDIAIFSFLRLFLTVWWPMVHRRQPIQDKSDCLDVAYLFPYPLVRDIAGGAMSHIRGVLGGLQANRAKCEIFSAIPLPFESFPTREIASKRRFFVFWESLMLSYGFSFARQVKRLLRGRPVGTLYQRHGRFTIAGALLSQWTGIPFTLEYNGSEKWTAAYWDPTRFYSWMSLCENIALRCASLIVVVSDPIKAELLERGIPAERIIVSPNAVDPDHFHPLCGGEELRCELGIGPEEVVVAFVGSFGPWHGVSILRQSIAEILKDATSPRIRFILMGDGPLQRETRKILGEFERSRQVIFTGMVPHGRVRPYLDAADILASPHVPLPDGKPFFGSPTKLFEYMAMGKAIVASRLDQLAQVLTDRETAMLVAPGSVSELTAMILLLAAQPELRHRLGKAARQAAIDRHTWKQNVLPVLAFARRASQVDARYVTVPANEQVADSGPR